MVVIFMQAGFAFLEIGFSRGKNAGTIVAKILTNFSIAAICWWAVGFALAFGDRQPVGLVGGRLLPARLRRPARRRSRSWGISDATIESKFFFQFVFCAVSLAIVWGTTLERIKFGVYIIYAIVFASLIYPLGAHWVFGGGFLQTGDWLGTGHRRHAGLRRLDGRPPHRRHRRARGAAAARAAQGQVRRGRPAAGDPRATTCRCSASAC